ncbi:cupin domain-containing protein [Streptomyces sp. I05A-00742]|uniref:cupin domain-containing protein n=1 Tax=Streptomyces sp. I05A-00742 TaxID=2732853 RepID=UPI001488DC77|nr:cupin domain-containing protein [Streptomyces sp. I05A-00742]
MPLDAFTLPDGTHIRYTKRTDSPETEGFEIEMTVPRHGTATPPHTHPAQTDEFYVQSGRVEIFLDGTWHTRGPGEELIVRPGHVHTYRNNFHEPVVIRNVHQPSGSFQEYLDRMGLLVQQGKITKMSGLRTLTYMSILFTEHTDAMRLHSPLLRAVTTLLAAVAKVLGLRAPRP